VSVSSTIWNRAYPRDHEPSGALSAKIGAPGALTTEQREELGRLRRENRTLRMERDILKKATAFFAKEHP